MVPVPWGGIARNHYPSMTTAAVSPEPPAEPFLGPVLGRILRIALAALLAASAILLAG